MTRQRLMGIARDWLQRLAGRRPIAIARAKEGPIAVIAAAIGALAFGRVLLAQLVSLPLPIVVYEGHNWRQAFTYGTAWNYAHTTLDVLRPRMFVELARSNVVAMEAPLYPLLASILLRVSGDSVVAPRILSWLALVTTLAFLWKWLADVRSPMGALADRAGLLVALGLSPMVGAEFRSVQPEPLAAGLAIASAFYLARYSKTDRRADAVKGAALFALSLLAKPLALGIAPALLLFAAWGRGRSMRRRALFAAGALTLALLPWLGWDRWAHHVLATELGGEWIIQIEHPPKALLTSLLSGHYSKEAFLHFVPNYAGSWWLVPALAAGIYRGIAERGRRRYAIPLLVWIVGFMIELLAIGERLHSNAYYFILAIAPLAYFSALGLGGFVRVLDSSRTAPSTTIFRVGLAIFVLLPIGTAFSRASAWGITTDFAQLGFERNRAVWTDDLGLARLLVVLVVAIAIGPRLRPRRTPVILGVPVFLAMAILGVRPARDAAQHFRYYTATDHRIGFDSELRELRSAVDRYSSPRDRILMSPGGTFREPHMVFYYYALRNGFPLRERLTPERLIELRTRGVRLYLQIDQIEKGQHIEVPGRLLASGSWWRLSCVAADDCGPPGP